MTSVTGPRVVHCRRESFDVYVGRPSKWGNPFSHKHDTRADFVVPSRDEAVARYAEWIVSQPKLMAALPELRGKTLACWCAPQLCHASILLCLSNQVESDETLRSLPAPLAERLRLALGRDPR